jgi:hypothetical protein
MGPYTSNIYLSTSLVSHLSKILVHDNNLRCSDSQECDGEEIMNLAGASSQYFRPGSSIASLYLQVCKNPFDWQSSTLIPVFKAKGDPMECRSYRAIKLLEHAIKLWRVLEKRIRGQVTIDEKQCDMFVDFTRSQGKLWTFGIQRRVSMHDYRT